MNEGYEIKADFYADWINHLKQKFSDMGYTVEAGETPEEISFKFFNVFWRRIPLNPENYFFQRNLRAHQSTKLDLIF